MTALFGAVALGANAVAHSIGAVMYMLPIGMTAVVNIRVGQIVGSRQAEQARAVLATSSSSFGWVRLSGYS
ncbi:MATE family efflux transporter [Pontivivens ytuae]|nr:MATE family efflux transporter [Pontivivens ytuae]